MFLQEIYIFTGLCVCVCLCAHGCIWCGQLAARRVRVQKLLCLSLYISD